MSENNDQMLKQQMDSYDRYLKIKDNPRFKKIWKYLENNSLSGKLLDIGCANGDFSEPLIKHGFDCYGLEYMEKAISESREKGIKVYKGSFYEKFPFEDNFFDIVFAGEVIEHTVDDKAFLGEVFRVLRKNGLLIITTPNLVSLGNRILMAIGKMPRFAYADFHYKIYNVRQLSRKINNAGFDVKKVDSNYVLISTFFSKSIGLFGEFLGSIFPFFGENLIIYAKKRK